MHKEKTRQKRWAALAAAASLLAVCIVLLAGQVVASDQGPTEGRSPLHRMEIAPREADGFYGPSSPAAEGDWDGCQLRWPAVISDTDVYRMWYSGQAPGNPGWGWVIGMAESEDGMTWIKAAGNPVLELGDPGEWDDQFRGQIAVLKDGGTYKMWYTGGTDGQDPWDIGYATSTDGSDWDIYASNPVLQAGGAGSWDEAEIGNPAVLKDGGTYRMWYIGCNADYSQCGVGYATSTDGVAWTKHAGNPVLTGTAGEWDEKSINSPTVVKNGGTYEMWYRGCNADYSQCSVGRATSPDGMAWTKDASNPVMNDGWDGTQINSAMVLRENGDYKMWLVSGMGDEHGIGLADSTDGVDWNDYVDNPVLVSGDPGLLITVNPDHDGVEGKTCRDAEVTVAVGDDEGLKATATGSSGWGGFGTWDWDWDPERPDIVPGDAVTATWGTLTTTVNPVGTVDGTLDFDDDTASGTIHAPWFSPQMLEVRCGVHTEGAPEIGVEGIAADGGAFTCDFGDAGWDLEPGANVWAAYVEPDGDGVMGILHSLVPYMTVDYNQDWVQGEYEAGHTVWITITESDGTTVKAAAEVTSYVNDEWGGWTGFETHDDEVWMPERPDIEPGDWAYAMVDNGYDNAVRVGTIDGEADRAADIVSGTISAPWLSPDLVTVNCEIHEDDGEHIRIENVVPSGGAFFCDFSGVYDIQFETNVAVNYEEPDSDRVQTHYREPVPDMRVEKWPEGSDQVAPGGPVVFGLRYRNDGDGAANTITLTDTLPADTVYDSDTSGVTPTIDGDQVIWTLGPLASREERQFILVLTNDADPGDTLTNQADIYTLYDRDDGNNHAEAEVQVVDEAPDLYIYKNRGGSEPTPGQTFLYEIDYGNDGPVPSGEVQLTDTLPEGTSIVSWSSRNGYDLWTEESSGAELVLSAPTIPGHWGDTLLLRLLLDAGVETGTQFTNTVEIETDGDTNPDNNQDERQDWAGDPNWNAGVDKQYGWGSLVPGREVGYNLHVRNHGNMATGVLLTDTLPAEATFVEASRWTGSTDEPFPPDYVDGEVVVWDLGTMEPGEWYDLNIRLKIKPGTTPGTVMRNCVTAAIDGQDTWPLDDTACTDDRVSAAGPNLRVRKGYRWDWEGQLKYDVLVENIGTTRLEDVWITDTYPESTTFEDDWWMGHGPWVTMTHDAGDREITFWAEEFDPGNSARISFRVDLDDGIVNDQGLAFTNTLQAPISGDVYPPDNQFEITAYTGPDLYARKWVKDGELSAGERITFTILYGNRNFWPWEMSDETEVQLTDRLPAGMTYVAAYWPDGNPNEPVYGGPGLSQIVWEDGRLGSEDTRWFTMVVDLDDDLAPGQVLLNEIEIEQDPEVDIDPIPGNNRFVYPVRLEGSKIYLPLVVRAH